MKHAKGTAKILGRVILAILILSLTLTGCGQGTQEPPDGGDASVIPPNPDQDTKLPEDDTDSPTDGWSFGYTETTGWVYPYRIAANAATSVFDIEDATINFSFGIELYGQGDDLEYLEFYKKNHFDFGEVSLYFYNCDNYIHYIKTTEDPFTSYNYDIDLTHETRYFSDGSYEIVCVERKFRHTEALTIPKELFTKDKGYVWFCIVGTDAHAKDPKIDTLVVYPVSYTKIDENTVELLPKESWTLDEWNELSKENGEPLPDESLWPVE